MRKTQKDGDGSEIRREIIMGGRLDEEPFNLVELIRHHEAISAITPSASRQMVRKGDIRRVRNFLDTLDIKSFSKPRKFPASLDRATRSLARRLPKGGWGAARKFLNLYLRRITYNCYLRRAYKLDRIEPLLELPMDSYAAKGLKRDYDERLRATAGCPLCARSGH